MVYTKNEVFEFIEEEDVQFIRLTFCDLQGKQKNISILPGELRRAFSDGISFDASAIPGFGNVVQSDLLLFPIASTLNILPWRPSHGKVVRMFCNICYPDGTPFGKDSRYILEKAVKAAADKGLSVSFGSEFEFYLFKTDEHGNKTSEPFDNAGYLDIAPADKGENVRREICLTLIDMGIEPENSHHEEGPGQNEIDFKHSDAITAADNAMYFQSVVQAAAQHNGLWADFSPKPIENESGNGLHINMSVNSADNEDVTDSFMAGILAHIKEMTAFLNPTNDSYKRLGEKKAPKYITWSPENRSQLIRIPAAKGKYKRIELRSPDPTTNLYIAYALLIYAGLDGIERGIKSPEAVNVNLYTADSSITSNLESLPASLKEAKEIAMRSDFIHGIFGDNLQDFLSI